MRRALSRPATRVVIGAAVTLAAMYGVSWVQVVRVGSDHGSDAVDAIVVMGAAQYDGRPSPQLAARLDHAAALWRDGVGPTVVVTGGARPGDRFTEAEASARYLEAAGVPSAALVEVGEGSSTYESVAAATPVLAALGVGSVALVTDPYHALRSRLILEQASFEVDVASTPTTVVTGWSAHRRELVEAAGVLLGRLIGFDRLDRLAR